MPRHVALAAIVLFAALGANIAAAPPSVSYLFPAGAQRGTTVEITAAGTFERWPVRPKSSGHGVSVVASKEKGKLRVTVAADAEVGRHWLWVYDAHGAAVPQPFLVGTLPEVVEHEPNDDPKSAQRLPFAAVTVNGRLEKPGDVDCFAVQLQKGQTLVAAMEAWSTLRSPMDAVLQVLSPDGFVLDQNNDSNGLDPIVAVPIPADGTYVVRTFAFPAVPDTTIRLSGAENYVYRLTLTTGGYADHAFPLAVPCNQPATVEIAGWNIPYAARRVPIPPASAGGDAIVLRPALAHAVHVRREPHGCLVKPSGHHEPFPIQPPVTVSSRLEQPRAVDEYVLHATKGQKLTLRAESQSLGLAVAAVVRVADGAGHELARGEPAGLHGDTEVSFTPPADGTCRVTVRDLYGVGGPRSAYRLLVAPPEADFALAVAADRFAVVAGQALDVPVAVQRLNGLAGDIDLTVESLPAGVVWETLAGTDPAKKVVRLRAAPDATEAGPFRIVGRSKTVPKLARLAKAALPTPFDGAPVVHTDAVWLTVTRPPPPKPGPPPQ